jgi:catechol 2,3-dioxygenase-like lactoylglutathione lyase family enzyme
MVGKKKGKKEKKAARKAEKEARKAAKRAAEAARLVGWRVAPKRATPPARKAAPSVAKKPAKKPVNKAAAARRAARPPSKPPRARQARQQPESLRLRSAGPSFTVNDIQKSLAFYRDVLGFTVGERWERDGALAGVELVAGSVLFWIGQDDWKKGRDRVKGQGFRMHCRTLQDIDALAQRVRARGGTLLEEPKDQSWGGRACAVVDPDGFAITFATGL